MFPLVIEISAELLVFPLNLWWIKTSQKKCCNFFCQESVAEDKKPNKRRKRPRVWVRGISRQRERYGECNTLVQELKTGDQKFYFIVCLLKFKMCTYLSPSFCITLFWVPRISWLSTPLRVKRLWTDNNKTGETQRRSKILSLKSHLKFSSVPTVKFFT